MKTTSDSTTVPKVHGLIGSGLIGLDAFDRRSWSGSSYHFFTECQRQGLLEGTSGAEVGGWKKWFLLVLRFHTNKATWRMRYYLDPSYRDALTEALAAKVCGLPKNCSLLQIGGLFDAPSMARQERRCYSYHDGNLAMRLRSPFGAIGLKEKEMKRALEYERNLYHRIDRIFTMSEYLRRSFIDDFGVPAERVVSIGAGANLDRLPEPMPEKNYNSGQILFIGVDFDRKGGRELLKAFANLRVHVPGAALHIVGPKGNPPGNLPMNGVSWHGFLNKDVPADAAELERLFQQCAVFVLPSLYEPFGIAPAEAMLYGLPAVVSGDWALAETVLHDRTGMHVQPGSVEELTYTLLSLITNPQRVRELGFAARNHAMNHFTWASVVDRLKFNISLA